jgi:hypothetical protein
MISDLARGGLKVLIPYDSREAMSLRTAAMHSGRSQSTMRNWCEQHSIGRHVGGVWEISRVALQMFLESDETALGAYLCGDRSSADVVSYFDRTGIGDLPRLWATQSKSAKSTNIAIPTEPPFTEENAVSKVA